MATTNEQLGGAVAILAVMAEAIRAAGSMPSGHLYALVLGRMTLADYEVAIGILKRARLVEESAHVLTWTGPRIEAEPSRLPCEACAGDALVVDTAAADRGLSSGDPQPCSECGGDGVRRCFYKLACGGAPATKLVEGWPSCEACDVEAREARTQVGQTIPCPAPGES